MEFFTIQFNYGRGQQTRVDNLDVDKSSIFEIRDLLKEIGVEKWNKLQYLHPCLELHNGLKDLNTDLDVMTMVRSLTEKRYVNIHVDYEVQEEEALVCHTNGWDVSGDVCYLNEEDNMLLEVAADSAIGEETINLYAKNTSDEDSAREWKEYTCTTKEVEVGIVFASIKQLKNVIVDYAVEKGYNIKFIKSEKTRLAAKCVEGCNWRMHASKMQNERTYQIKVYENVHTCARSHKNRHATAKWVARRYKDRFKSQPDWPIPSILESVRQDLNLHIHPALAYRARCIARKMNEGCGTDQYKQLRSYADEVIRSNPGTTFKIETVRLAETEQPRFQRAYVCFQACKEGLLSSGRRIICLDECHLKSQCPGHLLTAVSVDGNDGIYPISVAVVESECKDSWTWFLRILVSDLEINGGYGWTFMSDQQKGLIDTLQTLVPHAEQRFCIRHMYANFKTKFCGKLYKDAMMRASRGTTLGEFEYEMTSLEKIDVPAYLYLRRTKPEFWSKHAFRHDAKCDMTLNNLSESFNALILPARDKPIITMLEMIRKLLMTQIAKRRMTMQKSTGMLCPKIEKKLDWLVYRSRHWFLLDAGDDRYEVTDTNVTHVVDLVNQMCSCCMWRLTGIPCVHAVACISLMRGKLELLVHPCYHRQTYLNMYSHFMKPMRGPEVWSLVDSDPDDPDAILPPTFRRRPGRPKKKRIRDVDEPRSSTTVGRKGRRMTCRKCRKSGHNARSCEGVTASSSSNAPGAHCQTSTTAEGRERERSRGRGRGRGKMGRHETFMGFNTVSDIGTQGSSFQGSRH